MPWLSHTSSSNGGIMAPEHYSAWCWQSKQASLDLTKPAICAFVQVSIFPQATKGKAEFECQLYWYSFQDQLLDQICLAFAGRAAEQVHHQFFEHISKCTASAFSQVLLCGAATAWPFTWGDVQPQSQNIFTEKAQAIHNSTYDPLGPQ
jgi:hypothetical protein